MYKIYFTNEYGEARSYNEDSLSEALKLVEGLKRNTRNSFVVMTSKKDENETKIENPKD